MTFIRLRSAAKAGMLLLLAFSLGAVTLPVSAQPDSSRLTSFNIPAQNLDDALTTFAQQSGQELLYSPATAVDKTSTAVEGVMTRTEAIGVLLEGTGLEFELHPTGSMLIGDEAALQTYRQQLGSSVAGQNTIGQRRPGIEEIIVTGQKREERIQDVPIAISAFTQEDLTTSQIAGGPDLHLQVPNMTFTKTNFTGYSIQIRGIGTQAISATTDPAVAVALNNTPFIRNRFFEQEFYDLERLEVLRGPQGTLYGRNATAGVVNLITAKPKFQSESMASLDMGNYNSRRWEAMVNIPVVEDAVALRIAGAGTKRDGYATNEITGNPIDGRDLWSSRVSLRIAPTGGKFDMNLIWEHFEEDDDRLRSGKQLCHKDVVTEVGGIEVDYFDALRGTGLGNLFAGVQATLSQGCKRGSLYSDNAFQTPNGLRLPYYAPLRALNTPGALTDPYASTVQSKDLRVIESAIDPEYRARSDIGELQISYELTDTLTLDSETSYMTDEIFSLQDFNRFNTARGAWQQPATPPRREGLLQEGEFGGIFCDPQLGCSDRLVAVDVSSAESEQFSQELRLSSQYSGPFNFSLGANFLRYDTVDKYYVFANSFTLSAANGAGGSAARTGPWIPGVTDNLGCMEDGYLPADPTKVYSVFNCIYIDPNPIGSLNDQGHNYFLSKNPFNLRSYAVFGETYYNFTDNLKLTAGLRWSVDKKRAPIIPSQLLTGDFAGHPTANVIEQEWREPTGRLVLDWQPLLPFTDETLIYGSYAHGYKAGGANPPTFTRAFYSNFSLAEALNQASATKPKTFDAEFVDAFEIGTKNTLANGAVTLNLTAFYYDYEGYQVSEIVERSAFNRNFDLEVWGAELETDWWVTETFRLGFKGGYQQTRIRDGEQAVDLMDRTAGGKHFMITEVPNTNFDDSLTPRPESEYVAGTDIPEDQPFFAFEDWMVIAPFPTQASACVLPTYLYLRTDGGTDPNTPAGLTGVGSPGGGGPGGCELAYVEGVDPVTKLSYTANPTVDEGTLDRYIDYPGFNPEWAPNNGEGFSKDLGGNELPNAPNYTATLTADYIVPLRGDWLLTAHTDIYWQSKSWWRVFNDHEFGRLDDYFTMNVAAIFSNEATGWDIMAYVKNVTDETAITGAFLYSDDTALTTNAFLTEPRLAGIRVTKHWDSGSGGPARWAQGAAALLGKEPGEPSPFSLTLGGNLLRPKDAENEIFAPAFITAFDPDIDPTGEQAEDMDWGDGREIVLTYAPDNGWRFSLGARFGESNRDDRVLLEGETLEGCGTVAPCDHLSPYVIQAPQFRTNYSVTELQESEEHLLVDFMVGRDVGLGEAVKGTLSAGLRYAQFKSRGDIWLSGTPDWQLPAECLNAAIDNACNKYSEPAQHHEYSAVGEASREFEGIGPVFAWEASSRLFGDENAGHVDLDWTVSGGVLFGKQETALQATVDTAYFDQPIRGGNSAETPEYETSAFYSDERSDSVTVPTLGVGLGLTYRIGGASIGAGYHWERYFDVIDGGVAERREYDRTVDGPYLKVTFGGGS